MNLARSAALMLLPLACIGLTFLGCDEGNPNDTLAPPVVSSAGPPGSLPGGPSGPGGAGGGTRSNPKLKELMVKIGRGPGALQGSLGAAMKLPETDWNVVQTKAHEYSTFVSELGQHEPVKGTKDSWTKLTATFSQAAAELDQFAKAKDKEQTVAALDTLGNSCSACHREHRIMGPPGGGFPKSGPPGGGPAGGGFQPPANYPGVGKAGKPAAPGPVEKPAGEKQPQ